MAFEFRDILPAVGAVIGFGFGGPGGAAQDRDWETTAIMQ